MCKDNLRRFKTDNDLTWPQVAQLLGVTVGACKHWAGGIRSIPGTVERLVFLYTHNPELMKTVLAKS